MIKNMSNKYRLILFVSVLGLLVTLSTATFAYLRRTPTQSGNNMINTLTCLDINLSNITDGIYISGDFPVTDEKGKSRTPYTFTVTNLCDNYVEASINLESLQVLENPLSREYMKAGINEVGDGIKVVALDTTTNAVPTIENALSNKLMDIELNGLESKNFELRLWIDEDVTKEQGMNKNFLSKVVVLASASKKVTWDNPEPGTLLAALKADSLNEVKTPLTQPGSKPSHVKKSTTYSHYTYEYDLNDGIYGDVYDNVPNHYPMSNANTIYYSADSNELNENWWSCNSMHYQVYDGWSGDLYALQGMWIKDEINYIYEPFHVESVQQNYGDDW